MAYTYKCSITGEVFEDVMEDRKSWNKSKYLIQSLINEDREQDNREKKAILREYRYREAERKKIENIVKEDYSRIYHMTSYLEDYQEQYENRLLQKYWEKAHKRTKTDMVQGKHRSNKDMEITIDDSNLRNTDGMIEV